MATKVLNLYAGIGGNRKLWEDVEVTAVERDPQITTIYHDFFPHDTIIVGDAHQYLLEHYAEFDFIWSSPPCPSHSRIRKMGIQTQGNKPLYPDMSLYQEIIFLKHHAECLWCVENVIPYYDALVPPTSQLGRHNFWSNFFIPKKAFESQKVRTGNMRNRQFQLDVDISAYTITSQRKDKILRNCVLPELGLWIFEQRNTFQQLSLV